MVTRFSLLVILLTALVFVYGCESHRTTEMLSGSSESHAEWAVLLYLSGNYPGDVMSVPIEGSLSRTVSTIRALEATYTPESIVTYACICSPESNGQVGVYQIEYGTGDRTGSYDATLIADLGTTSMADRSTLDAFLDIAIERSEAERVVLSLCGNGAGWFGILGDANRPEGMSLVDLNSSLQTAATRLPSGRFDLLCLYTPNMSSIETLIELRASALFVASSPWMVEQPHSLVIREWYKDLAAQPSLDGRGLGEYVIDAERLAQDTSTADYFTTLWESGELNEVESAFDRFSTAWADLAPQHSASLVSMRSDARSDNFYGASFVDLGRYAQLIAQAPEFVDSSFIGLTAAANDLYSAINTAQVAKYGSTESLLFTGMNLYYPTGEVDALDAADYRDLAICTVAPRWGAVIDSLANRGNSTVTISGQAFWPGHEFRSLYFYADTTMGNTFGIYAMNEPEWTFLNATHDTVSYTAIFELNSSDSLQIEFGLFIDRDMNGQFNSGDSLGAWRSGASNFTPFTVYRGTEDHSRDITIRLRRP